MKAIPITIWIIDDVNPDRTTAEVREQFRIVGFEPVVVSHLYAESDHVDLLNGIINAKPEVDLVLVDGNLRSQDDGVDFIRQLRKDGYSRFTWLWSSYTADHWSKLLSIARNRILFRGKGDGALQNIEGNAKVLALAVQQHWRGNCESFVLDDVVDRCVPPLIELALEICMLLQYCNWGIEDAEFLFTQARSLFGGGNQVNRDVTFWYLVSESSDKEVIKKKREVYKLLDNLAKQQQFLLHIDSLRTITDCIFFITSRVES